MKKTRISTGNKPFTAGLYVLWIGIHFLILIHPIKAQEVIQLDQPYTDATNHDREPCITKEMHEVLQARTVQNIERLKAAGNLMGTQAKTTAIVQTYSWPLTYNSNFYDNDYYYIQNYIDHDPSLGSVLDYNCGDRTYDRSNGYNHTGTDICIGPYYWSMMDSMFVHVIAAAPGQIVDMDDGHYDRNCGFGSGSPNYVKIMHGDSTFAIYYHMKSGSVTSKIIGDMVQEGEYLGLVGSSGSSTNPHLHFELLDKSGNVVDPWVGSCNPDVTTSLWKNQLPYYNPGILRLMTLSGSVASSNCPDPEPLTIRNHFNPFETVRFEIHLRDFVPALIVNMTITDPSGIQIKSVNFTNNNSFSPSGYYYYNFLLPSSAGTYKMTVTYNGKTAVHYFTVGCPGSYTFSATQSGRKGYLTGGHINSTSVISSSSSTNIWYEAESFIQADPGFRATAGCTFTARINSCSAGGIRESDFTNETGSMISSIIALPVLADEESTLEIKLAEDDRINISIYDLTGRKIQTLVNGTPTKKGKNQFRLNTSIFPGGLYIIKMTGNHSESSCRMSVQH